jgi:hypothetical protein
MGPACRHLVQQLQHLQRQHSLEQQQQQEEQRRLSRKKQASLGLQEEGRPQHNS